MSVLSPQNQTFSAQTPMPAWSEADICRARSNVRYSDISSRRRAHSRPPGYRRMARQASAQQRTTFGPPSIGSVPTLWRQETECACRCGRPMIFDRLSWLELAMQFLMKQALAMILMAAALAPVDVRAQTIGQANSGQAVGTATPSNGAAGLTGKERLSEKWKDDQRIDNCKVPIDKRGTKARPDSCDHPPKD